MALGDLAKYKRNIGSSEFIQLLQLLESTKKTNLSTKITEINSINTGLTNASESYSLDNMIDAINLTDFSDNPTTEALGKNLKTKAIIN